MNIRGVLSYLMHTLRNEKLLTVLIILLFSAFLSQLISNVPATITLINHVDNNWLALAYGVNIEGVGTLIGSIANIIIFRFINNLDLKRFHLYLLPYFTVLLITSITLLYLPIV